MDDAFTEALTRYACRRNMLYDDRFWAELEVATELRVRRIPRERMSDKRYERLIEKEIVKRKFKWAGRGLQ